MVQTKQAVTSRSWLQVFTLGAAAATGAFYDFHPSQNSQWATDVVGVWQQYKVMYVDVQWIPAYRDFSFTNASAIQIQPMFVWTDPVDNSVPAAVGTALNRDTVQVRSALEPFTLRIVPVILDSLSAGTSLTPASRLWLSVGSNPTMYGLKIFMDNCNNAGATVLGQFLFKAVVGLRGTT